MSRKRMALGLLALIGFMALMVVLTVVYSTTETFLGAPVARMATIFCLFAALTAAFMVWRGK